MMYGYNPTYHVAYGLWQGDDGTQIPTVPTYDGEGAAFAITTMDNWFLTRWPDQTELSPEDFEKAFPDIDPLLATRLDDIVLRCEGLAEYVEKHQERFEWILLDDIPRLFPKARDTFRPDANEFVVRMPWGYCGNKIFNDCRQAETSVLVAERLNALCYMLGGESCADQLEESWKNLLVAQHHDVQICGLLDDEKEFISNSLTLSEKIRNKSLRWLGEQFTSKEDMSIAVFNPLSFSVKQTVEQVISFPRGEGSNVFSLWHGDQEIPCVFMPVDYKSGRISRVKIRFTADVPALTVRRYTVKQVNGTLCASTKVQCATSGKIKTQRFAMEFDSNGIRAFEAEGKQLFSLKQGRLFEGVIDNVSQVAYGDWRVITAGDEVHAEFRGWIGSIGIVFGMKFMDMRVDCNVRFTFHGEKIGMAETTKDFVHNLNGFVHENKLRFVLPVAFEPAVKGIRDLPFLVHETEDKYIQGNYWTACNDGNTGVAFLNKGAMCTIREKDCLSIPLAYANDYVWGARLLYGDYEHEFSILPFFGEWQNNDIQRHALAYEYPLVSAIVPSKTKGKFEDDIALWKLETSDNVVMSAMYQEHNKIMIRLYESDGKNGKVAIESDYANGLERTDLLGNSIKESDEISEMNPYEIRTYCVKRNI